MMMLFPIGVVTLIITAVVLLVNLLIFIFKEDMASGKPSIYKRYIRNIKVGSKIKCYETDKTIYTVIDKARHHTTKEWVLKVKGKNGYESWVWAGNYKVIKKKKHKMKEQLLNVNYMKRINDLMNEANFALKIISSQRDELYNALKGLYDACKEADNNEDLPINIDGSDLDIALKALKKVETILGVNQSANDIYLAFPDLLYAQTMGNQINTPDFLDWIAERLVNVYGESPNVDFVRSLKERANIGRCAMNRALLDKSQFIKEGGQQ